jgi:hypothetical protein
VSPEYGTRTEFVVSSAVPDKVIGQEVSPGAEAFPCAVQVIVDPLNTPRAVPLSLRSPAHVALNDPPADVDVWSVTSHLKSVQLLAEGIRFDDDQLPARALTPVADGPRLLLCSNSRQAVAERAARDTTATRAKFLIIVCSTTGTRAAAVSTKCGLARAVRLRFQIAIGPKRPGLKLRRGEKYNMA